MGEILPPRAWLIPTCECSEMLVTSQLGPWAFCTVSKCNSERSKCLKTKTAPWESRLKYPEIFQLCVLAVFKDRHLKIFFFFQASNYVAHHALKLSEMSREVTMQIIHTLVMTELLNEELVLFLHSESCPVGWTEAAGMLSWHRAQAWHSNKPHCLLKLWCKKEGGGGVRVREGGCHKLNEIHLTQIWGHVIRLPVASANLWLQEWVKCPASVPIAVPEEYREDTNLRMGVQENKSIKLSTSSLTWQNKPFTRANYFL